MQEYVQKFSLEETISDVINDVLKQMSPDPYSYVSQQFAKKASETLYIEDYTPLITLNNEGQPQVKIDFVIRYQEKLQKIASPISTNNPETIGVYLYDEEPSMFGGKGMKKILDVLKSMKAMFKNMNLADQTVTDQLLSNYIHENHTHLNAVIPLSFSIPFLKSRAKNLQLYQVINPECKPTSTPRMFINLLQGGKLIGSKSKIYRAYLILHQQSYPDSIAIINTVIQNVRKTITAGKLGEAALKYAADGTFICPVDTILDNMKIIEDAIVNSPFKDKCGIGLNFQADLFYNADKKNYELDNPKQLLDGDQLIDFYFKLCTDKPLIQYLEDPIFSGDHKSWHKLQTKFKDSKVQIGSRKLYHTLEALEHHFHSEMEDAIKLPIIAVRPYEQGTFSDFLKYAKVAAENQAQLLISPQNSNTLDTSIVDYAFATDSILNIGGPLKYEKQIKFNRINEILSS